MDVTARCGRLFYAQAGTYLWVPLEPLLSGFWVLLHELHRGLAPWVLQAFGDYGVGCEHLWARQQL